MQKRSKRLRLVLAVLLSVSMVLVALAPAVEAASYKKGSSGAMVTQIQTKLKSWGYYTGAVDGAYGSGTERAVRAFQQKNGLTVDGKAGDQTLAAMGLSAVSGNSGGSGGASGSQVDLLARLISAEARGAVFRSGGRRRRRAQPHQAPVVPEYALRRHLSERGIYVHHGRAV